MSRLTAQKDIDEEVGIAATSQEHAERWKEESDEVVDHLGRGGYLLRHGCGCVDV